MALGSATSIHGVRIRLTSERLVHITSSHKEFEKINFLEMLVAIDDPDLILKGWKDELLAVRKLPRKSWWLVVIYKEGKEDGFVVTAYVTTDLKWLLKREIIWNRK